MRLLSLNIKNIRGIRDLTLTLDGKSVVIWGPNGSGKSSIVDAIDYLFTGRISRLVGTGTKDISLESHGPHIDQNLESAVVEATLKLATFREPIAIYRELARPGDIEVCPAAARADIDQIGEKFRNGGVILTRRDIQDFVIAEAGKRADVVQNILNLEEIDAIRNSLQRANTQLQRRFDSAVNDTKKATAEVCIFLKTDDFSDEQLLNFVNELRQKLGGDPLSCPVSDILTSSLVRPTSREDQGFNFNLNLFKENIFQINKGICPDNISSRVDIEAELRKLIIKLNNDQRLLDELKRFELTLKALSFVDDSTTECPVCGHIYTKGHLKHLLDEKLATAKVAKETRSSISVLSEKLAAPARILLANISEVKRDISKSLLKGQLTEEQETLHTWQSGLNELLETLNDPIEQFLDCRFASTDIARLLAPKDTTSLLEHVKTSLQTLSNEPTPEQTALETLIRLEERVSSLEKRKVDEKNANLFLSRSEALFAEYESARESLLSGLYNRVESRFVEFYRILHWDEENFIARLQSKRASLDLAVDFMERGIYPPQALHSEGHQDSMGLCLYLALNEEIALGKSNLVVLDDVVTSIDIDHRKGICRLLKEEFPDHQFIITTHDKTWSKQLKQEQVVESNRVKEILNWTIEMGPHISQQLNMWEEIEVALSHEKVDKAAFYLRKGSEEFFETVCDALAAPVTYNSNGQWQLDDWLPAATGQYKTLLERALKDARNHNNKEMVNALSILETKRKQVYSRIYVEQWSINAVVHYNSWENLSKQDFVDVADAFRDLHNLFLCSCCGGFLRLLPPKGNDQAVRCRCWKVNWILAR